MIERQATIVTDIGYGDGGKGSMTDYFVRARAAHTVVRFCGGAQSAHNVVTPDGRQHVFSQIGAGTFVPGTRTHLSRHMILQPLALLEEARVLASKGVTDVLERLTVDRGALVISPFQRATNRLKELARGHGRHGSCGIGIGETVADALVLGEDTLRAGDLSDPATVRRKGHLIAARTRAATASLRTELRDLPAAKEEIAIFDDPSFTGRWIETIRAFTDRVRVVGAEHLGLLLAEPGTVVFEGAQGVLIDEWRGFHPYTTWSTCTFDNALDLLKEQGYNGRIEKIGVARGYAVRHGAGPFPSEDWSLTQAVPDTHNKTDAWQGPFRVGWFDAVAARYAIAACGGVDALAITCLDRLKDRPVQHICNAYCLDREDGAQRFFRTDPNDPTKALDIKLGPARDLDHQGALTERLFPARGIMEVTSVAQNFDVMIDEHLRGIARSCGVPVRFASFGPTADDKHLM